MIPAIRQICEVHDLVFLNAKQVPGGDISSAYLVETDQRKLFIKLNDAQRYPLMFTKEADGLLALKIATSLYVPDVVAVGKQAGLQYLLLEWLQAAPTPAAFWRDLAEGLAVLHRTTTQRFGRSMSNYIGSLRQTNNWCKTWAAFYASQRIMPLVRRLCDASVLSKTDVSHAERLCVRMPEIFPAEPPALLHGDLWAGNFMSVVPNGGAKVIPSVFDPAVYYGHREMDLGMTLLFGGFDRQFYLVYNDVFPLEGGWKKRVELTQLYPLLVHALLFGGNYISRCVSILRHWQ